MKKRNVMIVIIAIILVGTILGCNSNTTKPYQSSNRKITHKNDGFTVHRIQVGYCRDMPTITVFQDKRDVNPYFHQVQVPEKDTLYTYYDDNFFESKFLVFLNVSITGEILKSNLEIDFLEQCNIITLFSEEMLDIHECAVLTFLYIIEIERIRVSCMDFVLNKIYTNIEEEE